MTTKYPGATWRPIATNFTDRKRTRTDAIILHVTGSDAASQFGWFNNPAADASSHLHIALDGKVEQYVDLDEIAWTSGEGNARTIGIETAGTGSGSWTTAQLDALEKALAWLTKRYDVPVRLMGSSKSTEKGIGWHRLGIDGNFPDLPDIRAGRKQRGGGESWSKAAGKVCPGDKRIKQIPALLERLTTQEDPVADLTEKDIDRIAERVAAKGLSATDVDRIAAAVSKHRNTLSTKAAELAGVSELSVAGALQQNIYTRAHALEILATLRALGASLNDGTPITAKEVAAELAPLLIDDVTVAVAQAVEGADLHDAVAVGKAVARELAALLGAVAQEG